MRTRVSPYCPCFQDLTSHCWKGAQNLGTWTDTYVFSGHEKWITDTGGPRQYIHYPYGKALAYKPMHVGQRRSTTNFGTISFTCSDGSTCTTVPYKEYVDFSAAIPTEKYDVGRLIVSMCSARFPADTNGYNRWLAVKPTMATRSNMFVFLAELKDVKRMFDVLPPKHFSLSDWHSVLSYANNGHLNYNFGWKPFISDVKNTFRGVTSFNERLAKFVQEQNRLIDRRKADVPVTTIINDSWYLPYNSAWRATLSGEVNTVSGSHYQLCYSVPYEGSELRWRSLLDTLNLHASPANIWAIIPWSFVIDWFVDVGGGLRALSSDWTEPYINVVQGYQFQKHEYHATLSIAGKCGAPSSVVCSVTGQQYVRRVGMPTFQLASPSLDADKIRLLASLVGQQLL